LSGTITISPDTDVTISKYGATELTATYSGSEKVSYQWKRNGTDVSIAGTYETYDASEPGSYTVTVSAAGYKNKTSAAVIVTKELPDYGPAIDGNPVVGQTLTAVTTNIYVTGTFHYEWKQGGSTSAINTTIGTDSSTYTVTAEDYGKYITVTVTCDYYTGSLTCDRTAQVQVTRYPWTAVTDTGIWDYDENGFGTIKQAYINAVAYGNGIFVAGGEAGKMAYSTDGKTWTAVDVSDIFPTNNYTSNIYAIAYGNNTFVAGGYNGKMATSTDGITWTAVTSISGTTAISAITYGNGIFVAGGEAGKMAYSTDGKTWTAVADTGIWDYYSSTFGSTKAAIYAIAYGNGTFVAGGSEGKMATSTNGTTWTTAYSGLYTIGGIAYSNGTFVAVSSGRSPTIYNGPTYSRIATSSDGATWTTSTDSIGIFGYGGGGIVYGNGKFVAVGGKVATSSDNGATWTAVDVSGIFPDSTGPFSVIAYGNNTFVVAGSNGRIAYLQD